MQLNRKSLQCVCVCKTSRRFSQQFTIQYVILRGSPLLFLDTASTFLYSYYYRCPLTVFSYFFTEKKAYSENKKERKKRVVCYLEFHPHTQIRQRGCTRYRNQIVQYLAAVG